MSDNWKRNISAKNTWIRGVFMVLFAIVNYFVRIIILFIALVQFIIVLIVGKANERLVTFGSSISQYSYQILLYLTFNTDNKPFPFTDWPTAKKKEPQQLAAEKPAEKKKGDA